MRIRLPALALATFVAVLAAPRADAQRAEAQRAPTPPATVDRNGVLRWTATGREVALFGVNYAAPFAFDYRALRTLGVDHKRAIDQDVAHLARLGVDAFRIHVWDKEVSDREGNLLENAHLDLLDYLLARLQARGIKAILTPIAWWGPGYPEPDAPSPGFANGYSKQQMAVDTVVRKAQARYVAQFVAHVNRYTGRSYRDDPDIIAFEIFNEPWHDLSPPAETTRYINTLVAAMRGTGLRKPIFYNISEHFTPEHGRAVCTAEIQGVSGQWYPTGLVRGEALPGNPLPNVDRYTLPWRDFAECRDKALMVYEFDGADVAVPVMYPAMARAFRGAGFQWATQFAYDPLAIAHTNTEYQTHYLNLVYTPAKAISFLIAGEAFRQLPRGFDAGTYPASERFGPFRTSYADGLSELVGDTLFFHSSSTRTAPPHPARLRRIAGTGSSPVVSYDGLGAYFLEQVVDGIWRLEVYPDAVPVEEAYSRGSLRRTVTRVYHRTHRMRIRLPNLGTDFNIAPSDTGNRHRPTVTGDSLLIRPGVYLLVRRDHPAMGFTDPDHARRPFSAFVAPPSSEGPTVVRHEAPARVTVGEIAGLAFRIAGAEPPDSVLLFSRYAGWQGYRTPQRLLEAAPYEYRGGVLAEAGRTGTIEYLVTVFTGGRALTFPGALEGTPTDWDFTGTSHFATRVVPRGTPLALWDADRDRSRVVNTGYVPGARSRSDWVTGSHPDRSAWLTGVDAFGPTARHSAVRLMLRDETRTQLLVGLAGNMTAAARAEAMSAMVLRLRVRAESGPELPLEVALIFADGSAWGRTVQLASGWQEIDLSLAALRRVPLVLLPRPYPTFLPYDLMAQSPATVPDLRLLEGIQLGFARRPGTSDDAAMRIELESVQLVREGGH